MPNKWCYDHLKASVITRLAKNRIFARLFAGLSMVGLSELAYERIDALLFSNSVNHQGKHETQTQVLLNCINYSDLSLI